MRDNRILMIENFYLQKLREECYELVESIIRRGESYLKPAIAEVRSFSHSPSSIIYIFFF
jgi:hypothetical protein